MMSAVLGIDVSSHAVDLVILDEFLDRMGKLGCGPRAASTRGERDA